MQSNPDFSAASKKFGQNFQSLAKLRNQTHQVIEEYLKTTSQLRREDTEVGKLKQKYEYYKNQYIDFNLSLPPFSDNTEMNSTPTPESIERLEPDAKKEYLARVEKIQNDFLEITKNLNTSYSNLYNELDFQIRKRDMIYWESLRSVMYAYSCYFETGANLSKQLENLCKPKQNDEDEEANAILRKIGGTGESKDGFGDVALGTRGIDKKLTKVNARRKLIEVPQTVFPDVLGKNKLFGMNLDTIMTTDRKTGARLIPPALQQLFDVLFQYGPSVEGIFRIPGDNLYMENLKVVLERGETVPIMTHKGHFIHSIAGVLKLFIRDMAQPLMTYEAFDVVVPLGNPSHKKTDEEIAEEVHQFIVKKVPYDNVEFLFQFCKLLGAITERSDINKMHATNLGLIMGMSFFKPRGDDPLKIAVSVQNMSRVTTIIISHYQTIFRHKFEEERKLKQQENQETTDNTTSSISNTSTIDVVPAPPVTALPKLKPLSKSFKAPQMPVDSSPRTTTTTTNNTNNTNNNNSSPDKTREESVPVVSVEQQQQPPATEEEEYEEPIFHRPAHHHAAQDSFFSQSIDLADFDEFNTELESVISKDLVGTLRSSTARNRGSMRK
jgi:hypothetical protein